MCAVQFVDVLGVTSAITAIPAMLTGVSASPRATPVVATVYAMFFGGLLVFGARLGDRYGHRRVLLAGIVSFGVVSVVGATAQEVVQLVTSRALQGAAAAVSVPSALRLLLDAARGDADGGDTRRRAAIAAWSATGAAAGALGLLVGGALTDVFGWRAVFWVNVPVALLLVVAVRALVPRSRTQVDATRLDPVGAVLMIAAVMALILGASLAEDAHRRAPGGVLVAVGLALGAAFVATQRRARDPLVPRAALADANLRTGTVVSFVNTATTSSAGVLATLLMQQRLGVSAVGAGLALLPFSLSVVLGSALSTPLGARLAPRPLAALGLGGIAAGNVVLAATSGSVAGIVAGVAVAGTGLGIASVAATAVGTDVPDALGGSATGLLNTSAQLGTALGVAGLLVVAAAAGTATAWAVGAAVCGLTAAALLTRAGRGAPVAG
ncbi:MFS transporter [Virgisporangium ochraceum]|uniref:MFS transporter n=1 Tax=Virgisporangium ochraceum TaxID=65505 RepID=A0A8J3ZSJ2_9ACTN|nr:MFS transporter [Virgisporangium ochraceum]